MKLFEQFVNELNKSTYRNAGKKAEILGQDRAIDFYKASGDKRIKNYDKIQKRIDTNKSRENVVFYNDYKSEIVKAKDIVHQFIDKDTQFTIWEGNDEDQHVGYSIAIEDRNKDTFDSVRGITARKFFRYCINLFDVIEYGGDLYLMILMDPESNEIIIFGTDTQGNYIEEAIDTGDTVTISEKVEYLLEDFPGIKWEVIIDIISEVVKAI